MLSDFRFIAVQLSYLSLPFCLLLSAWLTKHQRMVLTRPLICWYVHRVFESFCQHCSKPFIGKHRSRKYCQSKCRHERWYLAHREPSASRADFPELFEIIEREKAVRKQIVGYSLLWAGNVGNGNEFPDREKLSRHDGCDGEVRFSTDPYWSVDPVCLPKVPVAGKYRVFIWERGPEGITRHRSDWIQIKRANPNTYFHEGGESFFDPRGEYSAARWCLRWPKGTKKPCPEGAKKRTRRAQQPMQPSNGGATPSLVQSSMPVESAALEERIVERLMRAIPQPTLGAVVHPAPSEQAIALTVKRLVEEQLAKQGERVRAAESELRRENAELQKQLQMVRDERRDERRDEPALVREFADLKAMLRADREASERRASELSRERDEARAETMKLRADLMLVVRERDLAMAKLAKRQASATVEPEKSPKTESFQSAGNAVPSGQPVQPVSIADALPASTTATKTAEAPVQSDIKESAAQPSQSVPPSQSVQPSQNVPQSQRASQSASAPSQPGNPPVQTPSSSPPVASAQPSIPPTILGLMKQTRTQPKPPPKPKRRR